MKHSTSQALRKNAQGGNTITRTEHSDYQKGEKMSEDLQEQACWLLLVFECGLNTHIVHNILEAWCYQDNRSLQAFFSTNQHEWNDICNLSTENVKHPIALR